LKTIAAQWVERFRYIEEASAHQEKIPPVLIVVCDNTEIAEVFFRKISGECEEEVVDASDLDDDEGEEENDNEDSSGRGKKKPKKRTVYGQGEVFPEYLSNTPSEKRTIRIDSRLLAEVEAGGAAATREKAAEALRQVIDTVGKRGQPGEHVRCVVSVAMLTEGWDANNVTHVLGIRAFDSQLLCEQVVGRGLRRISYDPGRDGLLPPEYVDVYGIPFSIIPFKGRKTDQPASEDRPRNHVYAVSERRDYEIRFPVVEGYVYALRQDGITCDIDKMEPLEIGPSAEPTLVWLDAARGYQDEPTSLRVEGLVKQDREGYYAATSL
jgi:type III restriction enzyme